MPIRVPRPSLSLAVAAALLAFLVSLAVLQYGWIARLSEAERDRLQASVVAGAARFCDDVDRELARAYAAFQPAGRLDEARLEDELATRLARWRASAPEPDLVRDLFVVTRSGAAEAEIRRFDEAAGRLLSPGWEPGLESVRRIFAERGRIPLLDESLPGLVLPVRESPAEGADERRPPRDHLIVRLDSTFLASSLLARAADRAFGGADDGLAYSVKVTIAARPGIVLFEGGPPVAPKIAGERADVTRPLFSLRSFPELAGTARRHAPGEPPAALPPDGQAPPPPDRRGSPPPEGREREPAAPPEAGRWLLEVRHPSGSLDAAVSSARRRNLVASLSVLLLVAATAALLVISTRRAQRLARQQMDFVAAVSHELKTPLTAIRSAGQNLADGIVEDPEKIRRYGALIEREGRRLTEMVGRVLAFAGIRSGSQALHLQPLAVRDLVAEVLADFRWVLEERQIEVAVEVAEGLPPVDGDRAALRQALGNLIDNAIKYGGPERWIGVRAGLATTPRGREVVLSVADRGAGIRRSDLPHLFEPFYRGADARAAGHGGSGLGLALVRGIVEAHGGRVSVASTPGAGCRFEVHLPVAAAAARGETAT